ncbi:beta-glucosidase BglX [uncultured Capnocytophaga sp.]|uniref:beta-glucosidase BglX n=1 Tax=uncultured Capnocytophaga sp. TaxID=159273 RepID=UPI00259694B5|nr:beta-glucosidase BglX [uncultured Capnocytophaga sp.]
MRYRKHIFKTLISLLTIGCATPAILKSDNEKFTQKSFSGDKHIEQRVDSVLRLMTLEEKIGQMTQFSADWSVTGPVMADKYQPYLEKGLVGSIFNATSVVGIRKLQKIAVEQTRLGIPILFGQDVIHGYKTIFPIPLAESCSWDLALMRKTAELAAREASADGINWTFAPMVDITRDARWGRAMEGAGEDPYLGSLIAEARVKGFQGGDNWQTLSSPHTLLACGKHFAGYGAAESGKDYNTAELSMHTLRNVYLPPYEATLNAGVGSIMASLNEINGVPATADKWLLTELLRKEWGFNGLLVSDYTGINELVRHGVAKDDKQAANLSANAGIEMDMNGATFIKYLSALVKEGKVTEAQIDKAVRHILEMKFLLGLFDDPYRYLDETRAKANTFTEEYLKVARQAVASSVVLLKNEAEALPIKKNSGKTIAVIGPMMNNTSDINGSWTCLGDGKQSVSLLTGLTEKYKDTNVKLLYAEGCGFTTISTEQLKEAVAMARKADRVLVAVGEQSNWSGESAVRTDIRLPQAQRQLLEALKAINKPITIITFSGRPLDLSWENENVQAILQAWFPGTQGGNGIADVIAGDVNPSGHLTMSFPRNVGQIPIYYNYKSTGRPVYTNNEEVDHRPHYNAGYLDSSITPLYPFSYGLSYTTFAISNVHLNKKSIKRYNDSIIVNASVQNTGTTEGEIVVQLYTRQLVASVSRPIKELKGFQKISLKAGESKQVRFELPSEALAFYGINGKKDTEPSECLLWVGLHSADNSNEQHFTIEE